MAPAKEPVSSTSMAHLVGSITETSNYDEAFLNITEGYCVFDSNLKLTAFSSNFPQLYPTLVEHICLGIDYKDYIRLFAQTKAVQNLGDIDDIEDWVKQAALDNKHAPRRFFHHLHNGNWVQIVISNTSTGSWFIVAFDVTELHASKTEIQESNDRFTTFAHLSMDWFWELDENLKYIYHSEHNESLTGVSSTGLVGKSRIETLNDRVIPNEYLKRHNQLLLEHKPIDLVLKWKDEVGNLSYTHILAEPKTDRFGRFTGYMGCGRDVTEDTVNRLRLNHLAQHDDLTGLLNRRAFESALSDALDDCEKSSTSRSLCFLDLDQFKLVNDGSGHEAGDQLLVNIAARFTERLGDDSLVARLGGDEFGVVINADVTEALRRINALIKKISSTPFQWNQRKYTVGASAGLVAIDNNSRDVSELMSRADTACYIAKNAGRNQAQLYIYDEFFQDPVSLELKQVNLLRDAMDNDGLMLFLQPIKAIQEERTDAHFEVLLRLRGYDDSVKSAGEFIPVAEKYDLMQHLDKWVVREALCILNRMISSGIDASFSINLSGNSLNNAECFTEFESMIIDSGIPPQLLTFEVTETSAIKNLTQSTQFINQLKSMGCSFSLDDFGSGLSSFGYLKELPVDLLKIDGGFVKEMKHDPTCRAIVSAFNQLSHELNMKTVAEFVEDEATEAMLRELGVDFVQGFGVGAPQNAEKWIALLEEQSLRTGTA